MSTTTFPDVLRQIVQRLRSDERGFTILEVLVSALLLAVVSVGLLTAFDNATKASGTNKARTVASQLAQADQERLRSMTGSQLVTLGSAPQTSDTVVDGRTFTVTSSAVWINDPTGTGSCGGLGKEPGYQRITSSVSWTGRGALQPVKADSLKAVPNGGYSTTRGSLAVKLTDRGSAAVNGIPVSISGPTTASATTSNGCALFGFVPVGTYTVTIGSGTSYVRDVLPNDFVVTRSLAVQGEQTSTVNINYDKAASLGVSFYTGAAGTTSTTGEGFSVANSGLGSPYFRGFGLLGTAAANAFTGSGGTAVASTSTASPAGASKVLFPFTAYRVWAGKCQVNDPTQAPTNLVADPNASVTVTQGGAMNAGTAAKVLEPTLTTTVSGGAAAYFRVTPTTAGCSANTASSAAAAVTSFAQSLPFGSYTVCAQDKPIGQNPTKRSSVSAVLNNVAAGRAFQLPAMTNGTTQC